MMKWFALAGTLAALTPAAARTADALPDRPIARTEVIAKVKALFGLLDTNRDGVVTPAEFHAYLAGTKATPAAADPFTHVGAHWFERNDADGDGRVTLAEAEARPLRMFDMADVDKDGVVSVRERQMAMALMSLGK